MNSGDPADAGVLGATSAVPGRLGTDAIGGTRGAGIGDAGFSGAGFAAGSARALAGFGAGATDGSRATSARLGTAGVGPGCGWLGGGGVAATVPGVSDGLPRRAGSAGRAGTACSVTVAGADAMGLAGELAGISVERIGPERMSQISTPALTSITTAATHGHSRRAGPAGGWCTVSSVGIVVADRSRSAFLSASRM